MQPTVLVVDDDTILLETISCHLARNGWNVVTACDGAQALRRLAMQEPDVIVLDLRLPDISGLELCRQLRSQVGKSESRIPILMLTAYAMQRDKVEGLEAGADHYLTKPFDPRELIALLHQMVWRAAQPPSTGSSLLRVGPLELNLDTRTATCRGIELDLKPQEFALLRTLAQEAGRVVERRELLEKAWNWAEEGRTRTTDIHVSNLRRKLAAVCPNAKDIIITEHGRGYRLNDQWRSPEG